MTSSLTHQARAMKTILSPLGAMIDAFFGWGDEQARYRASESRTQLNQVRMMREAQKEQREQALFELKYTQEQAKIHELENRLARQSLEIDMLRKEMGLDAKPFNPQDY